MVATYVIEIAIPLLFFAPIRRLRLFAFYSQVGGQRGAASGAEGLPRDRDPAQPVSRTSSLLCGLLQAGLWVLGWPRCCWWGV